MPFKSSAENTTIAATELAHAMNNPDLGAPFSNIGNKNIKALHQLANIFKMATKTAYVTPTTAANNRLEKECLHKEAYPVLNTPDPLPRVSNTYNSASESPYLILPEDCVSLSMILRIQTHHTGPHIIPQNDDIPPQIPSSPYNRRPRGLAPKENIAYQYKNSVVHPSTCKVQEHKHLIKGADKAIR